MKTESPSRRFVLLTAFIFCLAIYVVDLTTPLGLAIWVLYLVPVFVAAQWGKPKDIYLVAACATVLAILSNHTFQLEVASPWRVPNLLLQIGVLWFAAYVTARYRKMDQRLRAHQDTLEEQVQARTALLQGEIAERMRMEAELRASERKYRMLAENVNDLVWTRSPSGAVTYVSPSAERIRGYTAAEMMAQSFAEVLTPEQSAVGQARLARYLALNARGERIPVERFEAPFTHKNGSTVLMDIINSGLYDEAGNLEGFLSVGRDITERKAAEARLSETLQRLQLATEAAEIGVWNWNFAGNALEWDAQMYTIYGMDDEIRRAGITYDLWRSRIHPDDLPLVEPTQGDPYQLGAAWKGNYRIIVPGPSIRYIQASSVLEYDGAGQPKRMIGINRDITEQKAHERLLQDINADLEQRVAERTAELYSTVAALERANAGKDAFMAAVSHELRTPLAGILGLTESLEAQFAGPLNERQLRFVGGIKESGERLLEMVTSILNYIQAVAQTGPVEQESCRLLELAAASVRTIKPKADRKHQRIELEVEPATLEILSERDGILKVLNALLDNAVKFTPEHGRVGVRIWEPPRGGGVNFEVWDTGIGIAADQLPLLFEPFTQLDQRLAREYEGIGLGLAFVKCKVTMLGGTVAVESKVDQGSWFCVKLPRA